MRLRKKTRPWKKTKKRHIPAGAPAPKSPFVFEKLDWPAAEEAFQSLRDGKSRALVHGVPGSAKAFLLAWFYRKLKEKNPWLLVTPTPPGKRPWPCRTIFNLASDVPVYSCPSWETLRQDVETPDPELVGERQRTFYRLTQGEACIVVAPLLGALQRAMTPEEWIDEVVVLKKGQEVPADLKQKLVALGYESVTQVVQLGQFAARGGILDLASPGSPSGPVRLELFGDTLDSVRPLDILNQRSSGNLEEVYVFPAHEIVLKDETRYNLRQALKDKVKAGSDKSPSRWARDALELFGQTHSFPGWQWQGIGALEKRGCLFDYLPKDARIFVMEPLAFERKWEELQDLLAGCNRQAKEDGSDLFDARDLFSDIAFLKKALEKGRAAGISQIAQGSFPGAARF